MLRGLRTFGISHSKKEDILANDPFEYGKPSEFKKRINELSKLPDCFVCCNDFVARSTTEAKKPLGFSVSNDTCIIGYDGVKEAYEGSPTITTFRVDSEFLGQETTKTLISRIENRSIPGRQVIINSSVLIGESTKK